ncbi:MAG: PEP-CTERM sorting domain-containing protein [Sedimentisphaerales bacterium]
MIKNNTISIGCQKVIFVILLAVFFCGLPEPAYCETGRPVLLIQQIPDNGGTITPGAGVHYLEQNTSVTLTAVPKAGYQFVYWLGDVSDPTLNRTTAYLDAPKIVVAIFERAEYELEDVAEMAQSIPGGYWGGLRASSADYSRQGYSGGGGVKPSVRRAPSKPPEPEPPLPQEIPVPIPEPATVVLLAVGSFLAFAGRRSRK